MMNEYWNHLMKKAEAAFPLGMWLYPFKYRRVLCWNGLRDEFSGDVFDFSCCLDRPPVLNDLHITKVEMACALRMLKVEREILHFVAVSSGPKTYAEVVRSLAGK